MIRVEECLEHSKGHHFVANVAYSHLDIATVDRGTSTTTRLNPDGCGHRLSCRINAGKSSARITNWVLHPLTPFASFAVVDNCCHQYFLHTTE